MKQTMKNLPICDRPFEKFKEVGSQSLSDRELLTILVRSGGENLRADEIARYLLEYLGEKGLPSLLDLTADELMTVPGIGRVKAIQLLSVAELSKRIAGAKRPIGNHFRNSAEIADYYLPRFRYMTKEHLAVLFMDIKNIVIREEIISIGRIDCAVFEPRDIFIAALRAGAASLVVMHNHPSGDPKPSEADIEATKRLVYDGKMLGIPVLDHIILGYDAYYSMRDSERLKF